MSEEFTQFRKPSEAELSLLQRLAATWDTKSPAWVDTVLVKPMNDGGMGSLELLLSGRATGPRRFGSCVAEYQFFDSDGVLVIASLYVDQNHQPFELDVWKTDFSPLISIPRE